MQVKKKAGMKFHISFINNDKNWEEDVERYKYGGRKDS